VERIAVEEIEIAAELLDTADGYATPRFVTTGS
jgi:hypothetical protein